MVKITTALAALLPAAAAWPTVMEMNELVKRGKTDGRLNTGGGHPVVSFSEDQLVDVSAGSGHEFQSPKATDLRGQCPGLNAAANHGFIPRNGLATIFQTITGMGEAYNMSPDLALALAAAAILTSGDIPSLTWSIGGRFPSTLPLLLSEPKGLLGTHNKYEGDSSIVRGDAYLNDGNVYVFQNRSWSHLLSLLGPEDNLDLAKIAKQSSFVTQYSENNNPYYFSGAFSGLVAPAAHNFVVNFMSNHSAENPGGFLNKDVVSTFFAVEYDADGNFKHNTGQERIPENWYKRPGGLNTYNAADVIIDVLGNAALYPDTLRIGGNTGTTNSFTVVDVADLTGGVFNGATLLEGNNLACFAFQAAQAASFEELNGVLNALGDLLDPVLQPLSNLTAELTCPQLKGFNSQLFSIFPGYRTSA